MEILELLRASADSGMTILLITHGLETVAQKADRLLLLSSGRVAAEGTAAEVIREDVLRAVYEWPISVESDPATRAPRVTPMRRGVR
jgi:iron complex transport system ATP-binding protein